MFGQTTGASSILIKAYAKATLLPQTQKLFDFTTFTSFFVDLLLTL